MKKSIFLLLTIIFISCDPTDDMVEPSDYVQYFGREWLTTEVNFLPQEVYPTTGIGTPQLKLRISTTQIFECLNFGILTTQFINDEELIIRFDEIVEPSICLTSPGSATTLIDLPENITKLTFINGNVVDRYTIAIHPEKVSISLIENTLTNLLFEETFRIPENSFVYICGTNLTNTNIYTDFLAILEQNPNFTPFEFVGQGRIPYPITSNGHAVDNPTKFFTFTNSADFFALANVLDAFADANIELYSGTTIQLISWENRRHLSWD